jgi:protease I
LKKVVFLIADMLHEEEFKKPRDAIIKAGHQVVTAGMAKEAISSAGEPIILDLLTEELDPHDYDGVVIPGGTGVTDSNSLRFVADMVKMNRLVGCICHGAQLLLQSGSIEGRRVSCIDPAGVQKAGGIMHDQPVAKDGKLVTAMFHDNVDEFTSLVLRTLAES